MSYQLCSSCRHSFPSSALEQAAFKETVAGRLEHAHDILETIVGRTPADTHQVHELRLALRDLAAAVHEEAAAQQRRLNAVEELCVRREKDLEAASARMTATETKSGGRKGTMSALSGTLNSTAGGGTLLGGTINSQNEGATNRVAFGGVVPTYQLRRMNSALELVSASIYCVLESLAIQTRVDTALLWMKPRGFVSLELVAPFVVGRDVSKMGCAAPYRVSEVSIPCAASSTGIAINIKPRGGIPTETRRTEDIPLNDMIEKCNVAQLLMPVHSRYTTQGDDSVIAVVHLLGSPRFPVSFTRRNEQAAMHAAAFLSTIISAHHETMIVEWANHFYDPSILRTTSTYRGDLDLRGDEKTMDDFSPPEMLIYRCSNERVEGTDPREEYKALKAAIGRKSVPVTPVSGIKELHKYASRMESNWVSAVDNTSHLEMIIGSIKEEALHEEVQKLREQREKVWGEAERVAAEAASQMAATQPLGANTTAAAELHSRSSSHGNQHAGRQTPSQGLGDTRNSLREAEGASPHDRASAKSGVDATDLTAANGDLKHEQVDQLEAASLQRLRELGVDTTPFLTQ